MKRFLVFIGVIVMLLPICSASAQSNSNSNSPPSNKRASVKDGSQKLKIKSKPDAEYTREACRKGVVGEVILKTTFTPSKTIEDIEVLQGLPEGLTESAIAAARKIKFKPAMKNGQAIPTRMELHYNFNWNPIPKCEP